MENKKIADIIIKQIHLFFISGLYGILLGLWYEFFRTLRKNFVHKNKMDAFGRCDFLFYSSYRIIYTVSGV